MIGTIDTYLIYRLTGGAVFATDHTNASRTLLYHIADLRWDADLCALFDVPIAALPDVRESSAHFGTTDLGGVLDHPIPICGVMGDSQAALFAERCFHPGMAKVTFGTGSSVLLNIGDQMVLSQKRHRDNHRLGLPGAAYVCFRGHYQFYGRDGGLAARPIGADHVGGRNRSHWRRPCRITAACISCPRLLA